MESELLLNLIDALERELQDETAIDRAIAQLGDLAIYDQNGLTPLHMAVKYASLHAVTNLLEAGADPQSQPSGKRYTPMMIPFVSSHVVGKELKKEIFDVLLQQGIDLDMQDIDGNTVLHHAARLMNLEMVEYLIEHCSSVDKKNARGQTPAMYMALYGADNPTQHDKLEMLKRLKSKGADLQTIDDSNMNLIVAVLKNFMTEYGQDPIELIGYLMDDCAIPLPQDHRHSLWAYVFNNEFRDDEITTLVHYLIKKVDINERDANGFKAIHHLYAKNRPNEIALFKTLFASTFNHEEDHTYNNGQLLAISDQIQRDLSSQSIESLFSNRIYDPIKGSPLNP